VAAALVVGISVGAACWSAEAAARAAARSHRVNDVRRALRDARSRIALREQAASAEASRIAGRSDVQDAFVRHEVAPLVALTRLRPDVAFALWNGRLIGTAARTAPTVSVTVYTRGQLAGRVIVAAAPTTTLLDAVRARSPGVRLVFTVGGRAIAASPALGSHTVGALLEQDVSDQVALSSSGRVSAQLYAFRPQPSIPLRRLWPFLVGLIAAVLAFRFFERREVKRRAKPPPNTVRDAVALVGETLAATHNPRALLPVILQAAVEATDAVGGKITSGSSTLAARGRDRKSTRLNSSHPPESRMPSSA